jgi:deoxycytidylate deaminase
MNTTIVNSGRHLEKFYDAVKVAKLSECRYKHGSIIVRGKSILSVACNKIITHPIQKRYGSHVCSLHAETRAVVLSQTSVVGATCYSARIKAYNTLAISKPCAHCDMILREAGIRDVIYFNGVQIVKERL